MKWLILSVLFVTGGCTSTTTDEPSTSMQTQSLQTHGEESTKTTNQVAVNDDGDKLICYRQKQVGSHFSRKVCRTRRQIEDDRKAARDLLNRSRSHDDSQIAGEQ